MEEKKLVPKLRFPGFTEPWEQRKLGDYLVVSYLKNFEGKYDKEDVLSVSGDYGIVNQIDFQGRSFAGKSVLNYGIVGMGDIVYTKSPLKKNPFGIIKTNKLNSGIVSTLYAIYTPKKNCNAIFVEHYFELDSRLNEYLKPLVNKGAKNDMKVSSEKALDGNIIFPAIEEQKRISAFLEFFGRYITLHQRKLEHLKLKKKSLLQKLFPKEGEVYPEFRFPGFTDPWEQRKLGELADGVFGGGTPKTSIDTYWNGSIPWIQSSNLMDDKIENFINDKSITNLAIKESATKLIPANSIAIVTRVGVGKVALIREKFATSQDFLSFHCRHEHNPLFMSYQISRLMKVKSRLLQGTSIKGITKSEVLESEVLIPKGIEEENKIADFLSSCDNLITLHQRKLEHLQLLKKALLQQLFV